MLHQHVIPIISYMTYDYYISYFWITRLLIIDVTSNQINNDAYKHEKTLKMFSDNDSLIYL